VMQALLLYPSFRMTLLPLQLQLKALRTALLL
jgi:hypothetical protein